MADFSIIALTAVAEVVDSSLGMMYGTLLSPLLIALGHDPLVVVPALLFSQSFGGLMAAINHHKYGNANFHWTSADFKSFALIAVPGLFAVICGVFVATEIPKWVLKTYIGLLVTAIGIMILLGITTRFSFRKVALIGFVGAFNKALSGGGSDRL
uniref:Probable membrane transporter protein n=1 Tax=Candidatus Methanophaga sp. ANME-1 ERB7 TaxID=2759913 RepID=A0A7G9Z2H5_9EURY|nr:hypothetical protein NCOPHCNO_00010 [Methanosarcinales archaeon ANME-1 ERB7]